MTNQDDLIKLVSDPDTIGRAVEGSMDKRNAVLNQSNADMEDITWSLTYTARLLRKLPFSVHSKVAKRLVNDANALIMASPKDGYAFVDNRTGMFKGMDVQEQANRIERAINERD